MSTNMKCIVLIVIAFIAISPEARSQSIKPWKPTQPLDQSDLGTIAGQFYDPHFSPSDKDWVSFEVDRNGSRGLFIADLKNRRRIEVTTSGRLAKDVNLLESAPVTSGNIFIGELAWCPGLLEGKQWFAFTGGQNTDIYISNTEDLPKVYRITNDPAVDDHPTWSPDGKQLVFTSRRSGACDIYLLPDVPGMLSAMKQYEIKKDQPPIAEIIEQGKWITRFSDNPGEELFPAWSPDNKYVAYTLLNPPGDDSLKSELVMKSVAGGDIIHLYGDTSRILRNISFSPDYKFIAFYSAGSKIDETVNLIVGKLESSGGQITGMNVKWNDETSKRFEGVSARLRGGPYWGRDGGLYFLNESKSKMNNILYIPTEGFLRVRPELFAYEISSGGAVEYTIRDFDIWYNAEEEPSIVFSAQKGNQFGIFSDLEISRPPAPIIAGITTGATQYHGDSKKSKFSTMAGVFIHYPINDKIGVISSVGFGNLEGADNDANDFERSFVSSLKYLQVTPIYRFFYSTTITVCAKGGVGIAYIDSKNEKRTKGWDFMLPVGMEFEIPISSNISIVGSGLYNIVSGDLDGLPGRGGSDSFMVLSIGLARVLSLNF